MIALHGEIIKSEREWRYRTTYQNDDRHGPLMIEFCHDFTREITFGTRDHDKCEKCTPSWGNGIMDAGALRAAVVALVVAYSGSDWYSHIPLIRKHYRKYAKEVIANLPDKFTLTQDEILEWVKKQEQPKDQNESNQRSDPKT